MNTSPRTGIFIVDDLPTMRDRLRELVAEIEGVEIVGDAGTPGDAIEGILRTHPDCVLLDYQLEQRQERLAYTPGTYQVRCDRLHHRAIDVGVLNGLPRVVINAGIVDKDVETSILLSYFGGGVSDAVCIVNVQSKGLNASGAA